MRNRGEVVAWALLKDKSQAAIICIDPTQNLIESRQDALDIDDEVEQVQKVLLDYIREMKEKRIGTFFRVKLQQTDQCAEFYVSLSVMHQKNVLFKLKIKICNGAGYIQRAIYEE